MPRPQVVQAGPLPVLAQAPVNLAEAVDTGKYLILPGSSQDWLTVTAITTCTVMAYTATWNRCLIHFGGLRGQGRGPKAEQLRNIAAMVGLGDSLLRLAIRQQGETVPNDTLNDGLDEIGDAFPNLARVEVFTFNGDGCYLDAQGRLWSKTAPIVTSTQRRGAFKLGGDRIKSINNITTNK